MPPALQCEARPWLVSGCHARPSPARLQCRHQADRVERELVVLRLPGLRRTGDEQRGARTSPPSERRSVLPATPAPPCLNRLPALQALAIRAVPVKTGTDLSPVKLDPCSPGSRDQLHKDKAHPLTHLSFRQAGEDERPEGRGKRAVQRANRQKRRRAERGWETCGAAVAWRSGGGSDWPISRAGPSRQHARVRGRDSGREPAAVA